MRNILTFYFATLMISLEKKIQNISRISVPFTIDDFKNNIGNYIITKIPGNKNNVNWVYKIYNIKPETNEIVVKYGAANYRNLKIEDVCSDYCFIDGTPFSKIIDVE